LENLLGDHFLGASDDQGVSVEQDGVLALVAELEELGQIDNRLLLTAVGASPAAQQNPADVGVEGDAAGALNGQNRCRQAGKRIEAGALDFADDGDLDRPGGGEGEEELGANQLLGVQRPMVSPVSWTEPRRARVEVPSGRMLTGPPTLAALGSMKVRVRASPGPRT
jgi:hypothetical protein